MKKAEVRARIEEIGIIPGIRVATPEDARFAAEAVNRSGIPIAEITMNATDMPAFGRGSLPRYRFQPIANQWMPYAVNASAAMYNGGDFVKTCTQVSPMNKITPVTN